ncbi:MULTISPECIES: energy transducer TonB [Oleiagrimonas]|nr:MULTISPECIES: energy transducer TonB [Oleiagrimonas]
MSISNRRRARGAASSTFIFSGLIVLVIAAAGWFLVVKPHLDATKGESPTQAATKKKVVSKSTPPPANVAAMSTDQLLNEAGKAVREERLLSPAGNNAFEFYLKVLERQPNNQVAKEALRETFPFGANEAEQDINSRNFNEAQREIDLLAKADPDNYTLTILRSKLDAQRKTATKEQQQAQADLLAKQQAAQKQRAAAEAEKKRQAAEAQAADATSKPATTQPQEQQTAQAPAQPKKQAPAPVRIQNAVLVSSVNPRYPSVAFRRRQEGWVDVQFTVDASGNVKNATVLDAKPRHVFDRAAISAVERWKYRPALNNGRPFPVTMRRRINFSLGNQ